MYANLSILPPWKVIGNSKRRGEGGLKSQTFKKESIKLNKSFQQGWGGGGVVQAKKTCWGKYAYFLEEPNKISLLLKD